MWPRLNIANANPKLTIVSWPTKKNQANPLKNDPSMRQKKSGINFTSRGTEVSRLAGVQHRPEQLGDGKDMEGIHMKWPEEETRCECLERGCRGQSEANWRPPTRWPCCCCGSTPGTRSGPRWCGSSTARMPSPWIMPSGRTSRSKPAGNAPQILRLSRPRSMRSGRTCLPSTSSLYAAASRRVSWPSCGQRWLYWGLTFLLGPLTTPENFVHFTSLFPEIQLDKVLRDKCKDFFAAPGIINWSNK